MRPHAFLEVAVAGEEFEREIAEALTGAHFSWAQDQVIGLYGADRVAVLGLSGGHGFKLLEEQGVIQQSSRVAFGG
jgi:hypothetical protein